MGNEVFEAPLATAGVESVPVCLGWAVMRLTEAQLCLLGSVAFLPSSLHPLTLWGVGGVEASAGRDTELKSVQEEGSETIFILAVREGSGRRWLLSEDLEMSAVCVWRARQRTFQIVKNPWAEQDGVACLLRAVHSSWREAGPGSWPWNVPWK